MLGPGEADRTRASVRVDVLGPLRVMGPTGPVDLTRYPKRRELLVLLALATDPLPRRSLAASLRCLKNTLVQNLGRLNDVFPCIEDRDGGVALQGHIAVDAREFVDAVNSLPATPDPDLLLPLLRTWRDDPRNEHPTAFESRPDLAAGLWAARKRLVGLLPEPLPDALRAEVDRFAHLFPTDDDTARLQPPAPRPPGKLILVIDDTSCEWYADAIERVTDHKCLRLRHWDDWKDFRNAGGLRSVHGAVVDRHLRKGWIDHEGLRILEYLRDHTAIPAIHITIKTDGAWPDKFEEEFRLLAAFHKGGSESENLRLLTDEWIPKLVDPDLEHLRFRWEKFLDSDYHLIDRTLRRPPAAKSAMLHEVTRAYLHAVLAVKDLPEHRARAAFKAFQARYTTPILNRTVTYPLPD